jgi:NodT family efflux transporter outer membrane factor (OMF) lipoprotein
LIPRAFIGTLPASAPTWPTTDWWKGFGDPELSDLIARARLGNRDLAAAAARVLAAKAGVTLERAAFFPQIQADSFVTRGGGNSASAQNFTYPVGNNFAATFGASYELDFWGLARDNLRMARESLKSAYFAQEVVLLTIDAAVADEYLTILALRKRIALVEDNIAAIHGIVEIINLKVTAETTSHLDLSREEAQLKSVEAQLPGLRVQEQEARFALALLVGVLPQALTVGGRDLEGLQMPPVSPGLPSDLLLRRPDVAQAEADLAAAHANLDAARASFLPQFSLTSNAGSSSAVVGLVLHNANVAFDYGVNLFQTIFDGGKLIGQKKLAAAMEKELVAEYQRAVLNSLVDVETALVQIAGSAETQKHLADEVDAARAAFRISELQFRQGATDLLTVLQAQQTLFAAEDQLAQTKLAHMQAVVHLFEALGGGWVEHPDDRTQFTSGQMIGGQW